MGNACVFCKSSGPLSEEHVFPKWAQPFLADETGKAGTHTRTVIRAGEETASRTYRSHPATHTVKSVCESCNNGWMANLEARAKPYLVSMLRGNGRTYYQTGQTEIATWAVKTALIAGSKFEPRIPTSFYEEFFARKCADEAKNRVWLGETVARQFTYIDYRPLRIGIDAPSDAENGCAAVLGVGYIALYVLGWTEHEPPFEQAIQGFENALVPLWPIDGPTTWPPERATFTLKGMDLLADAMGKVP